MGHEIRKHSSFSSALGGEAHIFEARPDGSGTAPGTPVYFHGGHKTNPEKYLRYMAEAHGLHAFSIMYPAKRSRDVTYWAIEGNNKQRLHRSEVRKLAMARFSGAIVSQSQVAMAEDICLAIDRRGGKARAIGQSFGALSLTKAAADAPHMFDSIVLPFPAGMLRPDMRRVARSGLRYARSWQRRLPLADQESIEAYIGPPGWPVIPNTPRNLGANGDTILLSYHAPLLETIRSQAGHPSIAIMAGRDDHIFSPERIRQHVDAESIDKFVVVDGRHAIGDRRQVMDAVLDIAKADR